MKKIASAILAVIYLVTTTGAVIHIHYCMGKVTQWNFEVAATKGCTNDCVAPLKSKRNCCDDQQIQVKIDKDQRVVYNDISFLQHSVAPPITIININNALTAPISLLHQSVHSPPPISNLPVYLSNCNLRI